jgi:hypothetical protein
MGLDIVTLKNLLLGSSAILVACIAMSGVSIRYAKTARSELSRRTRTDVDVIVEGIINGTDQVTRPARVVINHTDILPPSDQKNRGTCWDFATLFLLESQYRANGIRRGFLEDDQYVLFSKQAYGAFLIQKCNQNKSLAACKHGGLPKNSTDDHKIPSLYYFVKSFPDLAHSILPESVCPYFETSSNVTDQVCDGLWEAAAKNPIRFQIKSVTAAVDIDASKRLLVRKQRPLGLSMPIGDIRYFAPCDLSNYSNRDECNATNRVLCPSSYSSKYCAQVDLMARVLPDGTFTAIDDYSRSIFGAGHEMNIVGYNDDWVYRSRRESFRTLGNVRGGFVVHNSWRSPGHSVEYFMGRRSEENEAVICPNHASSANWIPTDVSAINQSEGDLSQAPTRIHRIRGKGLTQHPDELRCKDSRFCNRSRRYALQLRPGQNEVYSEPLFSGFDMVHVLSWVGAGEDIREEAFDLLPFYYLHQMFEPISLVRNSDDLCGYWIVPYYALEMSQSKTWDLLDNFHTVDLEVEFTDASYAKAARPEFNYTLLELSTKWFEKVEFEQPLPYKYVY